MSRRRTFTAGRQGLRRGAAVVEMAMCLPILKLLLFGAYEFVGVRNFRLNVSPSPIRLREKQVRVEIEGSIRDNTIMLTGIGKRRSNHPEDMKRERVPCHR